MKNERTSKRVARTAGYILRAHVALIVLSDGRGNVTVFADAPTKALAASALTQAPDKPKAKRRGR